MNHAICRGGGKKGLKTKAFTLAEVLITLVIIGVIAAITVPSVLQSTQDREFKSKYKKVHSALQNAFRRAQLDEGMMGDNTALFKLSDGTSPNECLPGSYATAQRMAKYMQTLKVCQNSTAEGCAVYYDITYANSDKLVGSEVYGLTNHPLVVLNDGTFMFVWQNGTCISVRHEGESGEYTSYECGYIVVDLNGKKGPNRHGKDVMYFSVKKDKIEPSKVVQAGGQEKVYDNLYGF